MDPELSLKQLSEMFQVSELTIRRDLIKLQKSGHLKMEGGVIVVNENEEETSTVSYEKKFGKNLAQKQKIARKAVQFVNEGDSVFINAGTTSLEVIKILLDMRVTILTNNSMATSLRTEKSKATLILTGGEYNATNRSFTGQLALSLIEMAYASVCILGINGVTAEEGLTTAFYPETMVNIEFMKRSKGKTIVIADGSKIGKTYSFKTAPMEEVNILVTDSSAEAGELSKIKELGTEVIIA